MAAPAPAPVKPDTPTVQLCPRQTAELNQHLAAIENYFKGFITLYNKEKNAVYVDYESITVSSTAVGLTQQKENAYDKALITCEANPVRYRLDGLAPTASEGHLLAVGASIILENKDQLIPFQAIASGSNAILKVSYGMARNQRYAVMEMPQ
jgi:hypothetical protein